MTYIKIFVLLAYLLCPSFMLADSQEEILRLEADMLRYFSTHASEDFYRTTTQLKDLSQEVGDERRFYKAWGNEAIYEATIQNYSVALDIAKEMMEHSRSNGSLYGEYSAIHAKAEILLQKQDYTAAEKEFIDAVNFHHRHFPAESAGEDLQELMKIANHRKDGPTGVKYARQILEEPNVAPIHKGRALYRLSQMAFNKNDSTEFNRIYNEMMALKETDGISALKPIVEVNHLIINGKYKEALELADELDAETKAERKAIIFQRMGDYEKAYKQMVVYKKISDSITLVSHGNIVASCFVQMNNERLLLEQQFQERQNNKLRNYIYMIVILTVLIVLLLMVFRRQRQIKKLQVSNKRLGIENKDAAKALNDLAELSYYETKTSLKLTTPLNVNSLCNRLTTASQSLCRKGVTMVFQTELGDQETVKTDPDALEKMLVHLLDNAARFSYQGVITMSSSKVGENIRFTVSDKTSERDNQRQNRFTGMFAEEGNKLHYVGMTFKICQSIVALLQGRIWIDKEYNQGSRICFEIPQNPQ